MSVQKPSSVFWYLLALSLSLIGGVISFFVLRKSNPRKAIYCLIIGGATVGIAVVGSTLFNANIIILPDTEYWQGISQYIETYGFGAFLGGLMLPVAILIGIGFAMYNFLIEKIKNKPIAYGVGIIIPILLVILWQYTRTLSGT